MDHVADARAHSDQAVITDGPEPKHIQLSAVLARMASEELGPGVMVPSERALMVTYGVSRATVRKAVDTLIVDGLLRRVQGKGTFVVEPRLESRLHLASFTQDMRRRGLRPTTRLISCEAVEPPPEAAASLGMTGGGSRGKVWALTRVRCADDRPIALENGWYPVSLFPELDRRNLTGSLYEIFASDYGVSIDSAEQTLWGESADRSLAQLLESEIATPLLVFRRVSHSGGQPVEHVVSRYRGDRYQVHMSLSRDETSPS